MLKQNQIYFWQHNFFVGCNVNQYSVCIPPIMILQNFDTTDVHAYYKQVGNHAVNSYINLT